MLSSNDFSTSLSEAIRIGTPKSIAAAKAMLRDGIKPSVLHYTENYVKRIKSPLHLALMMDNLDYELINLLFEKDSTRFCADEQGFYPIEFAVRNGHWGTLKIFLEKDKYDSETLGKILVLLFIVKDYISNNMDEEERYKLTNLLIEKGADVNSIVIYRGKKSCLLQSPHLDNSYLQQFLNVGLNVNKHPEILKIIRDEYPLSFQIILQKSKYPLSQDFLNESLNMYLWRDIDLVALFKAGAIVSNVTYFKNRSSNTFIMAVYSANSTNAKSTRVALLLKYGVDPSYKYLGQSGIEYLLRGENWALLKIILEFYKRNKTKITHEIREQLGLVLWKAIRLKIDDEYFKMIRLIIAAGANVNALCRDLGTNGVRTRVIQEAMRTNNCDLLVLLLEAGADLNLKDDNNRTLVEDQKIKGNFDGISLLTKAIKLVEQRRHKKEKLYLFARKIHERNLECGTHANSNKIAFPREIMCEIIPSAFSLLKCEDPKVEFDEAIKLTNLIKEKIEDNKRKQKFIDAFKNIYRRLHDSQSGLKTNFLNSLSIDPEVALFQIENHIKQKPKSRSAFAYELAKKYEDDYSATNESLNTAINKYGEENTNLFVRFASKK